MKKTLICIWLAVIMMALAQCTVFADEADNAVAYAAKPILEYDALSNLGGGIFCAVTYDRLRQTTQKLLLDSSGRVLSKYDDCIIQNAGEGLIYIKGKRQSGYVDINGNVKIPLKYENGYPFYDGLARVEGDSKSDYQEGFIDIYGNVKIPLIFDRAGDFHEGLAWVEKEGKVGYINMNGKLVIGYGYSKGLDFQEGLASVKKEGLFGYIDKSGNEVIPFQYQYASGFVNGRAFVRLDNSVLIINQTGETIKKLSYSGIPYFIQSNGYFLAQEIITYYDGSHEHVIRGFDIFGNEMTFEQMEMLNQFSDGLAVKEKDGRFGYIDVQGNTTIDYLFEYAQPFVDGYAVIKIDGKYGIIEKPLAFP